MQLYSSRFLLRDFVHDDFHAFRKYQTDPRYRALYDIREGDETTCARLFELFLEWQVDHPRLNYQLGIFERQSGTLVGCGGVRLKTEQQSVAVLGLELAPENWGRYKVALEVGERLASFAFDELHVDMLLSDTSSGNSRVTKIARRYGAAQIAEREGPAWMSARGWTEVDWALTREQWSVHSRLRQIGSPEAS